MTGRNGALRVVLGLVPVLLGLVVVPSYLAGCAPVAGPFGGVARKARLADGLEIEYVHYEDERALVDSRLADGRVIALTQGGTLLAYDVRTLARVARRVPDSPGVMLADGPAGQVLLACQDGSIHQVHPRTLDLTRRYHVEAAPLWVGTDGKEVFAALPAAEGSVRHALGIGHVPDSSKQIGAIRNLATGAEVPQAKYFDVPSTWLLDRGGRLWMGQDNGEWGGFSYSLDLRSGRPGPLPRSDGVYGFVCLGDGQVWAYGGMSHMGLERAFVTRVDGPQPQAIYSNDDWRRGDNGSASRPATRPSQPRGPITHVVEARSGRVIVFSYSDVFRVGRDLKDWRLIAQVRLTYRPGRPDAMSCYPAVRTVHLVDGSEDDIICSTSGNGIVRVGGSSAERHEPFSFARVDDIRPSPAGPLLGTGDMWGSIHYWAVPETGLPQRFGLTPDVDPGKGMAWLRSHLVCADADSQVWAYDIGCWPGRMCLVRWTGQRQEVLAAQDGTFEIDAIFSTGDGQFWMCGTDRKLKRLREGRWKDVADLPEGYVLDVKALPVGPARWVLVAGDKLLSMECDPAGSVRVSRLTLKPAGEDQPWITDAAVMPGGRLLLATRALSDRRMGLCLYDPASGAQQWQPYPIAGLVERVFRDDMGRLWLGGAGLWMIDRDGRMHAFTDIPLFEKAEVAAIGPANRPGGVLVSLGSRGLVFVRPRGE